jgi:glycopeptide antibiotics resistance protein
MVGLVGLGLLIAVGVRTSRGVRRLAAVLLGMTTFAILAITLGRGDASLGRSVNLRAGSGIRAELGNVNHALGVVNVLGNIILFVPLGWLTAVIVLHAPSTPALQGLRRGCLAGLALSLSIEVLQYFLGRAADVDDVLLNTAGAVLGAATGATLSAARRRRVAAATESLPRVSSRSLPL